MAAGFGESSIKPLFWSPLVYHIMVLAYRDKPPPRHLITLNYYEGTTRNVTDDNFLCVQYPQLYNRIAQSVARAGIWFSALLQKKPFCTESE